MESPRGGTRRRGKHSHAPTWSKIQGWIVRTFLITSNRSCIAIERNVGVGRDHTLYALQPGRITLNYLHRPFRKSRRYVPHLSVMTPDMTKQDVDEYFTDMQRAYEDELWRKRHGRKRLTTRRLFESREKTQAQLGPYTNPESLSLIHPVAAKMLNISLTHQ